jgi:hypothetical protein
MKAISFWGLCWLTLLSYVDLMARNFHRNEAASNAEIYSPASAKGSQRKRIAGAISARRVFRPRAEVKAAARKPLAGVGVNSDD